MGVDEGPALQRRRLRIALRNARDAVDLTQRQVADRLDWSPSKVMRIENGQVGVSTTDLKALLDIYGISDDEAIRQLVTIARAGRRQKWEDYADILLPEFTRYLDLESSASAIWQFEPLIIPGLLQTEDYAREILAAADSLASAATIEKLVAVRISRQSVLTARDKNVFIIDEAAIRRVVGGVDVMRQQLRKLQELSQHPRTEIQILPYMAGATVGLRGGFILLGFPDERDEPVLYLENLRGDSVEVKPGHPDVSRNRLAFKTLQEVSTRPDRTAEVIALLIRQLESPGYDLTPFMNGGRPPPGSITERSPPSA